MSFPPAQICWSINGKELSNSLKAFLQTSGLVNGMATSCRISGELKID